jgi:hypothetical protein
MFYIPSANGTNFIARTAYSQRLTSFASSDSTDLIFIEINNSSFENCVSTQLIFLAERRSADPVAFVASILSFVVDDFVTMCDPSHVCSDS